MVLLSWKLSVFIAISSSVSMKCFVPTCRSEFTRNSKKNGWKSKHRFPKNTAQRYGWLQAIANAENITINVESINFRTARVCSEHFTDSSFCFRKSKRFLTDEAVPTVFQSNKENCRYFFFHFLMTIPFHFLMIIPFQLQRISCIRTGWFGYHTTAGFWPS